MHRLVASLLYYGLFLIAGVILRSFVRSNIPDPFRQFMLDLVTAFSALGCSLQNGDMRAMYGAGGFFTAVFFLGVIHSLTLYDSTANPCSNVVAVIQKRYSLSKAVILIAAQIIGAALSYKAAGMFWNLRLTRGHIDRLTHDCTTCLSVNALHGFAMESLATVMEVMCGLVTLSSIKGIDITLKSLIMAGAITNFAQYTGFFGNPMNASNQSLGCEGTSINTHLAVYWVSPIVTTIIVATVYNQFTAQLRSGRQKLKRT